MGKLLKNDFFGNFFLILLPKKLQGINFEEAVKTGSGNTGPQSLQKVCKNPASEPKRETLKGDIFGMV